MENAGFPLAQTRALSAPPRWVRLAVVVWLAYAAAKTIAAWPELSHSGPTDPDSLMRLVEVRDYAAGAAWTDLRQPRLDPPGVWMHWSRLADAPLAAILWLLSPVLGRDGAETALLAAWPMLLLGFYLIGVLALTVRLAGPSSGPPALVFAICSATMAHFAPGDIDHHNIQLTLAAWMYAAAVRASAGAGYGAASGFYGAASGFLAALSLSIGLETLPAAALAGAGLALAWAARPAQFAEGAGAFGLAFAAAMIFQRLISSPSAQWFDSTCDTASAPYVAAGVLAGAGLWALAVLAPVRLLHRGAGLAALGMASTGAVAAIHPACLSGPFGDLSPRLMEAWFHAIQEVRSAAQMYAGAPAETIGLFMAPVIALGAALAATRRARFEDRPAWALVAGALAVSLPVAAWAARGLAFSSLLAVPPLAWLVIQARTAGAGRGALRAAGLLAAAYLLPNQALDVLAGRGIDAALGASRERFSSRQCLERPNYAPLAALPKGVVLAPANLGPALLAHTPHSVVAANYHRAERGVLDSIDAFEGGASRARAIARRRDADYVVICPSAEDGTKIMASAPESLLGRLLADKAPPWLEPVEAPDSALRIWRVTKP